MKQVAYILTVILFTACGQSNRNSAEKNVSTQLVTIVEEITDLSFDNTQCLQSLPKIIAEEITSLSFDDTLKIGNFLLIFEAAAPFKETDIFGDLEYRRRLTDTIGNWHERAIKIEAYLAKQFGEYFYTTDTTLVLRLADGSTLSFLKWDPNVGDGEAYNFAHYFEEIDYYLLRVQYWEGNSWMLVNRKNGFKTYTTLPYISNDNKRIIGINESLQSASSFNGIELYTVLADSLRREFSKWTDWGPVDVKWINENEFLLKRKFYYMMQETFDYKRVRIEKKTCL